MHYLTVLGTTIYFIGFGLLIALLAVLALGFIASWLWDGTVYDSKKDRDVLKWGMKTRWLRLFYRFAAPPALVFGIPALVVWFS